MIIDDIMIVRFRTRNEFLSELDMTVHYPCDVCKKPLSRMPVVWVIPPDDMPMDYFVHPECEHELVSKILKCNLPDEP